MDFKEDLSSSDDSLGSEEEDNFEKGNLQAGSDSLLDSSDSADDMDVEDNEVDEEAAIQELQLINDQLAANPFSYDSYVAKIKILKKLGELEKLRDTREKFREMYPLSEELWLDWLKDEVKLACSDEEKENIFKLFDSAVEDYLSIDVWLEYLQFCMSELGSEDSQEKCRNVFERALGSCGLHVSSGAIVWDMYREFEAALLGITTTEEQQKAQEGRFLSLCRRQLSVPLLGMDKTFENIKDKIDIGESTQAAFDKALSKLKELESWEAKLVQEPAENKLQAYRDYIEFEKKGKPNPARIQCIYERAIAEFPLDSSLWHEYLDYLKKNLKIDKIVLEAANRAARNCSWDITIWLKYMKLVEAFTTENTREVMKSVFERAIVYCSTGEQAGTVWLKYLEFLKRKVEATQGSEKEVEILRKTFIAAEEHLLQLLLEPNEYMSEILLFRARFEAQQAKSITEDVTNLWKDIIGRGYGEYAKTWVQYILQETLYGNNVRRIRSHFLKAISRVQDDLKVISTLWINFERDNGDLSSLEQCEAKISEQLSKHAASSANYVPETYSNSNNSSLETTDKRNNKAMGKKRKLDNGESGVPEVNPKKGKKEDVVDGEAVFKVPNAPIPILKPRKEAKTNTHGESIKHDPSKDNRTVFLSNLAFTTGEDEIREFFKEIGTIEQIRLAKDFKGRSKGFGYVFFTKTDDARTALSKDRQPLGGRPAFVSKCDPDKSTRQKQFKYPTNLEKNKLFVKGLPFTLSLDGLKEIFKVHGDLKDCRLVTYRNGHSKGLAYVEYLDEVCAKQAIMKTDGLLVGDKKISVALSNPPVRDPSTKSSSYSKSSSSQLSSDQLQRRAPKAFVPRSLQINAPKKDDSSSSSSNAPKSNAEFRNMFLKN